MGKGFSPPLRTVSTGWKRGAGDLVTESDPRTCNDMLTDWERVCGLPAECMPTDSVNTLQVRRAAVVNVLNRLGGQTPEYFRRLAPNRRD